MKIKILRFVPLYVLAFLPLFSLAMTSMAIGLLLIYAIWHFIKTDARKLNLIRFRMDSGYEKGARNSGKNGLNSNNSNINYWVKTFQKS